MWLSGFCRMACGIHVLSHSNEAQRVVITTEFKMNPVLLLSILTLLEQIPVPRESEALDCAPWTNVKFDESMQNPVIKWVCLFIYLWSPPFANLAPEVEVCAGEANLSRALCHCGLKTKAFDDSWFNNRGWWVWVIILHAHQTKNSKHVVFTI